MWLRDSTAQVRPYLVIAKDNPDLADMISGLVKNNSSILTWILMQMLLMKRPTMRGIRMTKHK